MDDYVRTSTHLSCLNADWKPPEGLMTTVLGDDGRYHLFREDAVLCTEMYYGDEVHAVMGRNPRAARNPDADARAALGKQLVAQANQLQQRFAAEDRARHDGRIPHERQCDWWTDGIVYRMFAPNDEQRRAPREHHRVWWTVGLRNDPVDPSTVSPARRCAFIGGRSIWPRYTGDDRLGRIRQRLIDHAGPMCHACGRTIGIIVDHDHFTGMCRGLVCWNCNVWIDECPHLDGCPRADYLNNPPTRDLHMRYPFAHRDREHHRARIEYLGIGPLPAVSALLLRLDRARTNGPIRAETSVSPRPAPRSAAPPADGRRRRRVHESGSTARRMSGPAHGQATRSEDSCNSTKPPWRG
ncbi:hypothetical protein GCM10022222_51340 [Amycolatopsis ultiminotia]|uniref:Recombination endonuclease VII n=1 Tax=Amycolatopsis ultiminotia TaxID=543629 RepID=A0ABP6X4E7_9PSEU